MRPGQNKRMRGRPNNNNRRGPNPLTRSYESNGPDVKIRGNAHHVAEKYLQLARDAHTGGDPVAAENYLQHAEHYYRLIASAQAAQLAAQNGRAASEGEAEDVDDEDDIGGPPDRFASPVERAPAFPPPANAAQPQSGAPPQNGERPAYENERPAQGERQNFNDRNAYNGRQDRNGPNNRQQERGPRPDRHFQDRGEGPRDSRGQRDNRQRDYRPTRDNGQPQESSAPVEGGAALPSFITAAPRLNGMADGPNDNNDLQINESQKGLPDAPFEGIEPDDRSFQGRGRRRRMRTPFGYNTPGDTPPSEDEAQPGAKGDAPVNE